MSSRISTITLAGFAAVSVGHVRSTFLADVGRCVTPLGAVVPSNDDRGSARVRVHPAAVARLVPMPGRIDPTGHR